MIIPLQEYILLKEKEPEEKMQGGILLASRTKEDTTLATIICVGEAVAQEKETKLVEKAEVVVAKEIGYKVMEKGEEYRIVKKTDILAIVK